MENGNESGGTGPHGMSWHGDLLVIPSGAGAPESQCGTCGSRSGITFETCGFFHDPVNVPMLGIVNAAVIQFTRRHLKLSIPLCRRCLFAWKWTAPLTAMVGIGGGVPVFIEAKRIFVDDDRGLRSHWFFWLLFSVWIALSLMGAGIHAISRWRCVLIGEDGSAVFSFRKFRHLRKSGLWSMPQGSAKTAPPSGIPPSA